MNLWFQCSFSPLLDDVLPARKLTTITHHYPRGSTFALAGVLRITDPNPPAGNGNQAKQT
ncbi:hypothetical protein [Corynebacterium matruchotii]|uniref:hypothetical protein n=1 Tax=Corynebacterium matruchotii TaxID=43768 RepID=UPI003C6F7E6C